MRIPVTRTHAIKAFLAAKTHADLAALYTPAMECQVNVAPDGADRIEGEYQGKKWQGWTDHVQTWKSFRIPRNASTNPEYHDSWMTFDLVAHAEGIGMTGWDWERRLSKWVAFDFDAITGHSIKHSKKLTVEELATIQQSLQEIPWVTIRKSSGGQGLHVYVFLNPVITQNHNEHAALGRSILGHLSALSGVELSTQVDNCANNMWVWHRKMQGTGGLELLKAGIPLEKVPTNWQDHVAVISGHRKTTLPRFIAEESTDNDAERWFLELAGQSNRISLDADHCRLIKHLGDSAWWDSDHHMLVTHTFYLKQAKEALKLKGIFETIATGSEAPTDKNCYLFPMRRGSWAIRRYSMGVQEAPSWDQDGKGWTRCYYNMDPTMATAAKSRGAIEDPKDGGFVFNEAELAIEAARSLGASVPEIPVGLRTQKAKLKQHRDGRLMMEIEGDTNAVAARDMTGWLHARKKWQRLFNISVATPIEIEASNHDDLIRHLVTATNDDFGWVMRGDGDSWRSEPLVHIQKGLGAMNLKPPEINDIVGAAILRCWKLVNKPFQPEYPGDRTWNRGAAQFRYVPSQQDNLTYDSWMKILNHIGSGLDDAIKHNPWAKANGLIKGADYLKLWIASLLKEPLEPLPYLFLHGSQNAGKSILHESLSLLFTKGYIRADTALINPQGFNEELASAILCVIEELNLRKDKNAGNRIKDWVTARDISIHPKGRTPYHIPNSTHWIQCSNPSSYCPVFPGDTRITMIYVQDLDPIEMIPKKQLIPLLEKEAPDFLAAMLRLEIPPSNDRLNVPVIVTADKHEAERTNMTPLESFLSERCFGLAGHRIKLSELYDVFVASCDPSDLGFWTKNRFSRELPPHFPKGRARESGQFYVGNISFSNDKPGDLKYYATSPDEHNNVFLELEKPDAKTNP